MFERVATLCWYHPVRVLAVLGTFIVLAAGFGHDVEKHLKAAGFTDPASESEKSTELLRGEFGYDANPGLNVVIRAKDGGKLDLADPATAAEIQRIQRRLAKTKFVGKVDDALPAQDGKSVVVNGYLSTQDIEDDGGDAAEDANQKVTSEKLDVAIGGFAPSFNEVNDQTRTDLTKAELIAFPILALLLLLVFRGVIAASIPLVIGVASILGAFLFLRVMSMFVDTSLFALNIASGLSLGLAVDYALLMVTRYREEVEKSGHTKEAHLRAVTASGRTVVFSGFTVAAAMAALVFFPQRFLYSVGVAGASVGILASLIALFGVGSALALLGPRIDALSVRRGRKVSDESDGWYRLAWTVMRRPVLFAIGSTLLLLALASPLLGTTLTGPSAEAVPPSQPSYDANTYVTEHYPRSVTEAITVTLEGKASTAQLAGLDRRIRAVPGIKDGSGFERASPEVGFANYSAAGRALREPAQDSVRRIRDLPTPAGTELLVSGNTARFIDQKQSLLDHAPLVVGIVCLFTVLILFMLTGSVILPLKTLLMNTLTLAATLGIVVLGFQHGLLDSLFSYTGPNAIEVTSLVFVFAVTFGLATDYAVLVLARIKEIHDRGVPNEEAVAQGVGRTGRVITAAAVMISVVFLAFAVSSVFFMKQVAVAQAAGVLIDATIVRALLVPALMRLFGEWNWWAPKPLARFQERFGFSEG